MDRVHYFAGDILEGSIFSAIPVINSNPDIYLLSAVLHLFDDASCITVLSNIQTVIAQTTARIAILELVVNEKRADFSRASIDMQMFMGTHGRERTLSEWRKLFSKSAVELEEVVNLRSLGKILVVRSCSR